MINLAPLITSIQAAIAANSYLNSQLAGRVSYGMMPQQNGTVTTVMPYCVIGTIGSQVYPNFGDSFIDELELQFSVFATDVSVASTIIQAIGQLFTTSSISASNNDILSIRRCSSVRCVCEGQDANENYVYHASVDVQVKASGG